MARMYPLLGSMETRAPCTWLLRVTAREEVVPAFMMSCAFARVNREATICTTGLIFFAYSRLALPRTFRLRYIRSSTSKVNPSRSISGRKESFEDAILELESARYFAFTSSMSCAMRRSASRW